MPPSEPEKTAAEEMVKKADSDDVSIDSIGWLFIQRYYSVYNSDIQKLYELYDKNAILHHEEYPQESSSDENPVRVAHVARGNEAITEFFKASVKTPQKSKIVIESAEFQPSVGKSILIMVCGSWQRGTSHLRHFVQTFVLSATKQAVYDISNDVLKFVDWTEEVKTEEVTVKQAEQKEEKAEEPKEEKEEKEQKEQGQKEQGQKEQGQKEQGQKEQEQPEQKERNETSESKPPAPDAEEPAKAQQLEPEKNQEAPAQKPTWATLAAIEPKGPVKSVAVPAKAPVKKLPSPPQTTQSIRYKKEDWYPIYIKNVEVEEDELKNALIKQFGDIKYFKKSTKTALCDFKQKEDQLKALEAKEIIIRNNRILLEQRVHKAYNGKPEAKKEKKVLKKPLVKKP